MRSRQDMLHPRQCLQLEDECDNETSARGHIGQACRQAAGVRTMSGG